MRNTETIEPMWEDDQRQESGSGLVRGLARLAGGVAGKVAPHLLNWASAQRPEVRVGWGLREYHLQREGVVSLRRQGEGWDDNPRRNYNEAVEKRQQRQAAREAAEAEAPPADAEAPPAEPEAKLNFSAEALQSAVAEKMGISPGFADGGDAGSRDPEALKQRLADLRGLLQSLDDVADYDLVEAVDEELYQLHKAVEYKLRNHKASEAKAQLTNLFK